MSRRVEISIVISLLWQANNAECTRQTRLSLCIPTARPLYGLIRNLALRSEKGKLLTGNGIVQALMTSSRCVPEEYGIACRIIRSQENGWTGGYCHCAR